MKITLINPPFVFPSKSEIVLSQCLGLRSLSAYLKVKGGHEINFIDALMLGFENVKEYANGYIVGLEIDDVIAKIPSDTELIALSAPFSQLAPIIHDIVERARNRFPQSLVVIGGVYSSTQPKLALTSKADFIIKGEGEIALAKIAAGSDPSEIQGVYSRKSLPQESFPSAQMIDDLDKLPFSDYSVPLMDQYFNLSQRAETGRTASLVTSRGCPFACEFCSIHPIYGRCYRARSAAKVLEEIEYLVDNYGIQTIEFEDDNFTLHKQRTIDILRGIIRLNEKGANLAWSTPNGVRIDSLDEEVIKLMKKSNCKAVALALEHGDPEMLKIMNKKLDLDKAFEIIKLFIKYKISRISLFVIVGYPGETKERFTNCLDYLKRVASLGGNFAVSVHIAQPYPGTKLMDRAREEGIIKDENLGNFLIKKDLMGTGHFVPITTPDFDTKEVLRRKEEVARILEPRWKFLIKKYLPWAVYLRRVVRRSLARSKGAVKR